MLKINIFYVRGNNLRVDLVIVSAPLVAVPDFRVVELTDHGNILLQLRKGTQVCGNEDAALCVELCIERIGEVVALDASCLFAVAERADLVLQTLPFRFRIDGQTSRPLVTVKCSPSSSRSLAGIARRPLASMECLYSPFTHSHLPFRFGGICDTLPHISPP